MMTTTQISLDNVRLYAYHGVMEQERRVGGWYTLTVVIDYPFLTALDSDNVADTLNYAEVLDIVKQEMAVPSNLIEHVAGRICRRLIAVYNNINKVSVRLTKDNPPMSANCDGASVLLCVTNDKTSTK